MRKYSTYKLKRFLLGAVLAITLLFFAVTGMIKPFGSVQTARAAGGEVTLVAEVSDIVAGQANPEFTVTLKFENNSGAIGGAEIIITPLDDNVSVGTADANYVAGGTWSAANGGARIDNGINVHLIGTDDAGITANSFTHGGYKFSYSGTPSGAISFNIALEAVCDDMGDDIAVRYNNQTLTNDTSAANFTVTPRSVDTTNTLSGLTLTVGGTQILSGTGDSQTVSVPIANADKGNIKLSATRSGAASKIKVEEGGRTIVAEQTADVTDVALGDLDVGEHTLTITVTSESGAVKTYTVKFAVAEPLATPITKPAAPSTTTGGYSGSPVDFTPNGMAALVSSGQVKLYSVSDTGAETEVSIDAFKPTNAGSYKIVARPTNGYCWDGDDTSDAEYTFSVSKAKLSAVAGEEGKLPTFISESYKGSTDGIVEFKYYSDAACTQEISKSSLTAGTKYYVKPVLKDGAEANFEFDSGSVTQGIVNGGAEYVAPDPSGNNTNDGKFKIPLWVWFIVAAIILVLILVLILLFAKRNKKEEKTVEQSPVLNAELRHPQSAVVHQEIAATEAKTEKLEDRVREMEKEASAREVTRYKEEAERAERKAERTETPVVAPVVASSVADTAAEERVKELEARMREMENATHEREFAMEKEAHERELTRYKEEAARAEKKAETSIVTPVATSAADTAAQERVKELEARMREMEKEAHEKEVARYKEEAAKAEKKAETSIVTPVATSVTDTAAQERVKELEARMREMEREAHEKELARQREEIEQARKAEEEAKRAAEERVRRAEEEAKRIADERIKRAEEEAKRAAEERYYAQFRGTSSVPSGDSERVRELEARIREMEKDAREVERSAHDRELSRYKDDVEQARREAERTRQDSYYGQSRAAGSVAGDSERVKELEARIREMEKAAQEREIARYKEEAEAAKRAAEERYYTKHPMPETTYVPYRANEEQASPYVQKLEEQLRRMEKEAHERELARYRSEAERARKEADDLSRKSRQQEEELKRLQDLQAMEQRSREIVAARAVQSGGTESSMLQRMEEQMRRQDTELQALTEELSRRLATMQNHKQ